MERGCKLKDAPSLTDSLEIEKEVFSFNFNIVRIN